jgi:hypothetical protein
MPAVASRVLGIPVLAVAQRTSLNVLLVEW